jgi:hypothetical protein
MMNAIAASHQPLAARTLRKFLSTIVLLGLLAFAGTSFAQQLGGAGTIKGTVSDPTGAVLPGATVTMHNVVTGFERSTTTDTSGNFVLQNIPQNPYHATITAPGFQNFNQDVDVRSSVPVQLNAKLNLGQSNTSITITESADLLETEPTQHTDIGQRVLNLMPLQRTASGLSDLLMHGTPGVVADSNGFFHPQGDHAQTQVSLDGQPITDQQSRNYSNQISPAAIQSLEVITGVPPAEFGDKDSLVVRATTKSGLGQSKATGSLSAMYGSFGTGNTNFDLGFGNKRWGDFLSVSGLRSGRFLDAPEFQTLHDVGNSETIFNRVDFQPRAADSLHLDLFAARSWYQIPNTFDQAAVGQDQRQKIVSFNIAPGWTHLFSPELLLTANAYLLRDHVNYYPSENPLSDVPATLQQSRQLTNTGFRADLSYVKGRHNAKIGVDVKFTPLRESFRFGITDPTNAVFQDANGNFIPSLAPFDLTNGGTPFQFHGTTTIKQQAMYVQDTITLGRASLILGARGDHYDGLSQAAAIEPRAGLSYLVKRTGTVLRAGYGREFETPYNENVILSSSTGSGGLASVFGAAAGAPLIPGRRNHFTAGLEQAFRTWLVVDADYFWKYTTHAFDFDTLFNTPVAFPIEWARSKIDGAAIRVTVPEHHGFSLVSVMGHTRSRFFNPENGGIIFNAPIPSGAFRIDHDQAFQQNTTVFFNFLHKLGGFTSFTWDYQSGLVAGRVPFATDTTTPVDLTGFSFDEQAQIGLMCGGVPATLTAGFSSCAPSALSARLVKIPAPGTENDDKNPPRIAPRNLFNVGIGLNNLLRSDKEKMALRFTVTNLTNKVSLYNFESTFSGTHFVSPRAYQVEVAYTF